MTDRTSSTGRRTAVVPAVVAVVALLVAAGMALPGLLGTGSDTADEATDERSPKASRGDADRSSDRHDPFLAVVRRDKGDPLAVGDVDAPVVMVSYSEFQCPFCGKFARDTEPELVERFVEDGTLRIEWRDFPYLGPESTAAARAGRAAAAQDGFWEFHDAMYADQQPPNSGRLTPDYLVEVAEGAGLDPARFREDMRSKATEAAVQRDFEEGQSIGVTGTPAFLVNGQPVMGAQPTEVFVELIEQAAQQAAR